MSNITHVAGWKHDGLVQWTEGNTAYLSVVFSWKMQEAYQQAIWWKSLGYDVVAGGPAVMYRPDILRDVAEIGTDYPDVIAKHNSHATLTSRGCIRHCKFCIVPTIEGKLQELDDWPVRSVICDNNLNATSLAHFDKVIDRLKPLRNIDIQNIDARILTKHQAERLAELDIKRIHIAFDHIKDEDAFRRAYNLLRNAGILARCIRVYVLIGYDDTPEDALYRLNAVREYDSWPMPMRFSPLDEDIKHSYVGPNWNEALLNRYVKYWSNMKTVAHIPFDQLDRRQKFAKPAIVGQTKLFSEYEHQLHQSERSIPCDDWEINAFMKGAKTIIVRPVRNPPEFVEDIGYWRIIDESGKYASNLLLPLDKQEMWCREKARVQCEYFPTPDTILYMQEFWGYADDNQIVYRPDGEMPNIQYKSPITMPKKARRIFMRLDDVDVKLVNEITEIEAIRAGWGYDPAHESQPPLEWFKNVWHSKYGPEDAWVYILKVRPMDYEH